MIIFLIIAINMLCGVIAYIGWVFVFQETDV